MIVGNPAARGIMQDAFAAYRRHGLSIQGMLPAFRTSYSQDIVRDWFWIMALRDWAHIDYTLAVQTVGDLSRAAMTPLAWRIRENAERAVRRQLTGDPSHA